MATTNPPATDWSPQTIPATNWSQGDFSPPTSFILQEDGFNILQEDGSLIGLEQK